MANGIFPLINVSNLDKTLEFYRALGLKTGRMDTDGMDVGSINSGDGAIYVFPKDQQPDVAQPADTKSWLSGELGKGVLLNVGVPSATKSYEKAKAWGASFDETLTANPWGGMGYRAIDPDGYVVAITDKFPGPASTARKAKPAARKAVKKAATSAKKGKAKKR